MNINEPFMIKAVIALIDTFWIAAFTFCFILLGWNERFAFFGKMLQTAWCIIIQDIKCLNMQQSRFDLKEFIIYGTP